jgi:catechol 2,3-dioxygenase-like lactoylglutathione lyase family enzyme
MHTLGFHHLAVQVRDVERAARFYRDVLGLPERARYLREDGSLRSVWVDVPGGGFLALEVTEEEPGPSPFKDPRPGWFLLSLRIRPEERADVEAHLARHGVEVVHRSRWTLYVRDPEGNRVGLSHHPEDPPEPRAP